MKITKINILNYRSIGKIEINNINNQLILVGKNNSGKSSTLNALRVIWKEIVIEPDDFHKDTSKIEISLNFQIDEEFFLEKLVNSKIGLKKLPSSAAEFNSSKLDTEFAGVNFAEYKVLREEILKKDISEIINSDYKFIDLWKKTLKNKLSIENSEFRIKLIANKDMDNTIIIEYKDKNDNKNNDLNEFLPKIAFIDDDRNFEEEENGKAKTLTNELFGNHILKKSRNQNELVCDLCVKSDCNECIKEINKKKVEDLELNDLEKLIKNKISGISEDVSEKISEFFSENYENGYKIYLNPKSNVDKSFSIGTQIFDPNLQRSIELSKVGAGIRSIYILSLLQAYHKMCNNKFTLFLVEEPEIYLHPSLQKNMGETLYEISQENQLFLTTHSPLLLKNFDGDNIKKVKLNSKKETEIENSKSEDILCELGYSIEDILTTDFVVIVEGKDDIEKLELLIKKYYNVDVEKIFFLDTKSCNNIEFYATLRFLRKTTLSENFLIFRDSDTIEIAKIKSSLNNKFKENFGAQYFNGIEDKILVTEYSSFENYFLDKEILKKISIIKDDESYYSKIEKYIKSNREFIEEYLRKKNSEERSNDLIKKIYSESSLENRIDDIKRYVRGHNLFGQFSGLKSKINKYIEESKEENFTEIINHLDKVPYFKNNKRQLKIIFKNN